MTEALDGIPAAPLPISASAPGKAIVLGEHAVVHGAPELLFALDLRTQLIVQRGERTTLNGDAGALRSNPYLARGLERLAPTEGGLELSSVTRLPRAAGLGSSAAFVAALSAALGALGGGVGRPELAQIAYEVEREAQGVGSPGDTSAAVAGGFLALNATVGTLLWEVRGPSRTWTVRRVPNPGWGWVVADTGVARATAPAVEAVGQRLARPDGPELLDRFREVAQRGIAALVGEDREAVGASMRENQSLLREVGVSHPRLEALLEAAAPTCVGEKLTGAGRGGSVVALPKPGREIETVRRLRSAGASAFSVLPAADGARLL